MPEVWFRVRWPDGAVETCYSPSSSIAHFLVAGTSYPLEDFLARSRAGLGAASERVWARHGFPCSRALGQLARIEQAAAAIAEPASAVVTIETLHIQGELP